MAWTSRKRNMQLFVLMAVLLTATVAYAQQEMLWRVKNPDPPEPPPAYAGNLSPFPVKQKPVEEEQEEEEEISPEIAQQQQQAMMAARLLAEVREILSDENAFVPDTSGLVVEAVAVGPKGGMILMDDRWLKVGESVEVPIVAADRVLQLVERLEGIDANLSGIVDGEVQTRLQETGPALLEIGAVGEDYVELVDADGRPTVIPFIGSGW